MKISTRLLLIFLLLSVIPMGTIGYIGYRNGLQTIKQDTIDHLVSMNLAEEADFNRWINSCKSQIKALAQRPLVRKFAAQLTSGDIAAEVYRRLRHKIINDHFEATIKSGTEFIDLSLLNKSDGRVMVSTDSRSEGKYRKNDRFFIEGQHRTFVDEVSYWLTTEKVVLHVSTPIVDDDGHLIAVLSGNVDLKELSNIMRQGRGVSQSQETYLVNRFNYFVTESRFAEDYPLKKTLRTKGTQACLAHGSGIGLYDDYRGIPVIGAYRWMPEWNLCILTEEDQQEAFAPAKAFRKVVAGASLAIGILATLTTFFFVRNITRRIAHLVRGAEAFSRGNFDFNIDDPHKDELGMLAETFNHMAQARKKAEDTIRKSRDELERRVVERTAEIVQANRLLKKEIGERSQIEAALRSSEQDIRQSLSEKEVLLREVHHRVKNNMQMIQSLLNLQAAKVGPAFKASLTDSNSRIKSMALVHETLYRSDDIANLDLDSYFRQLVKHLYKIYLAKEKSVETIFRIEPVALDMDASIASGLILNELVTNALKYAFQNGSRTAVLEVGLRLIDSRNVELSVGDNGAGLPESLEMGNVSSLGLKIVSMLAEDQLHGQILIDREAGTRFRIIFPLEREG
jgi:two-component sensor histidine kinase